MSLQPAGLILLCEKQKTADPVLRTPESAVDFNFADRATVVSPAALNIPVISELQGFGARGYLVPPVPAAEQRG